MAATCEREKLQLGPLCLLWK
ncbi:uncharacterized protein G2W53_027485 [Senna tora]|uniref:Uncharacterized protein n=1 Tax=Senna tora TaxID=362788 RepID=A0A834THS0_9FABA|nr:uncharacterized protein G2W53_027485 [Senna tora]